MIEYKGLMASQNELEDSYNDWYINKKYEQNIGDIQNTIKIPNKPIMDNEKEFYVNSS